MTLKEAILPDLRDKGIKPDNLTLEDTDGSYTGLDTMAHDFKVPWIFYNTELNDMQYTFLRYNNRCLLPNHIQKMFFMLI